MNTSLSLITRPYDEIDSILAAAVLTNTGNPELSPAHIAFQAALLGLDLPFPSPLPFELTEGDLIQFSGNYTVKQGTEVAFTCLSGAFWFAWAGQENKTRLLACARNGIFDPKSPLQRY